MVRTTRSILFYNQAGDNNVTSSALMFLVFTTTINNGLTPGFYYPALIYKRVMCLFTRIRICWSIDIYFDGAGHMES